MKKFTILLLAILIVDMAHATIKSGSCGTNLRWSLNTDDGALIVTGSGALNYRFWDNAIKSVTLPSGLTSICENAFRTCNYLRSINIPSSVISIGRNAFLYCYLDTIHITDIGAWCNIDFENYEANPMNSGAHLYLNNQEIENISIPNGTTQIKAYAFSNCLSITSLTIPQSVTSIGDSAFHKCTHLLSVTIPQSVTNIGSSAFYDVCNVAYSGTVTGAPWGGRCLNGCVEGYLVYSNNAKTTLVCCTPTAIGDIIISDSVTNIQKRAFRNCKNITSITIPGNVTRLNKNTFSNCSSLTDVHITNLAVWCNMTFDDGQYSNPFTYASNLYINDQKIENLIVPSGVTSINDRVFEGCNSLTSVMIPNSVTSIGRSAFEGCKNLSSVTLSDSVTSIGEYTFSGCSGLTSIIIPNSVTSIGKSAFEACSNLSSVTMPPSSLTSIGSYAFFNCTGLTSIRIPTSVRSIGSGAFTNVNNIEYRRSSLPTGSPWGAKCLNGYVDGYLVYSDNTKSTIVGCSSLVDTITIPNYVASIDSRAFQHCSNIALVTINSQEVFKSSTPIGSSISKANPIFPDKVSAYVIGETVTSIGSSAFSCCENLKSVSIGSNVTSIGSEAFIGCIGLTDITLPDGVTSIGQSAFGACSNLSSITIPNSVTSIGSYAFHDCTSLTSISIPDSMTSIPSFVFYGCTNLTSITIPNNVTSIGKNAFTDCSNLTTISIPNRVTNIGGNAFRGCSNLGSIYCFANTPPTIYSSTFGDVNKTIPLYVPSRKANTYRSQEYWDEFTNIIDMGDKIISFQNYDGTVLWIDTASFGQMPIYGGSTPIHPSSDQYSYIFIGWDKDITEAERDGTYTAQYDSIVNRYLVSFIDEDGTILQQDSVEYGLLPTYQGITPVKSNTAQYSYAFMGWDKAIALVTGAITYTAQYSSVVNKYLINYINEDGAILQSDSLEYGQIPTFRGEGPFKSATAEHIYTFDKWMPLVTTVVSSATYQATYTESIHTYAITFTNYDGVVLQFENVGYGMTPNFSGETPTKPATAQYTYTFKGWDKEIISVVSAETYTAQFDSIVNKYMISFVDEDGTILQTSELEYGQMPTYIGPTPFKPSTAQYTYTFKGWDKEIISVVSAETYTAQFDSIVNKYMISFVDEDGTILQTSELEYGQMPTYIGPTPFKPSTAQYTYTFAGWSPELSSVTGAMIYTATYTSMVNQYIIKFVNEDGTVLQTGEVEYGQVPTYNGTTPTKPATAQYTYTFKGWDKEIISVVNAETYTAQFDSVVNQYTITVSGENCTITGDGTYDYGTEVILSITPDEGYQFVEWSDGVTDAIRHIIVTADATYTTIVEELETGWQNISPSDNAQKIFDGTHYYILRNGKRYTLQGVEVQ